jgi:hypothetical protein
LFYLYFFLFPTFFSLLLLLLLLLLLISKFGMIRRGKKKGNDWCWFPNVRGFCVVVGRVWGGGNACLLFLFLYFLEFGIWNFGGVTGFLGG